MLFTYFVVGLALAIPELILIYNWPWLKRIVIRWPIGEIVFSLGLAALLGAVQGVAGVTLAVANVFATLITLAVHHGKLIERYKALRQGCATAKVRIAKSLNELSEVIHVLNVIFVGPFRFIGRMMLRLNRFCGKCREAKQNVKVKLHLAK